MNEIRELNVGAMTMVGETRKNSHKSVSHFWFFYHESCMGCPGIEPDFSGCLSLLTG
jgi:hypothetical protein